MTYVDVLIFAAIIAFIGFIVVRARKKREGNPSSGSGSSIWGKFPKHDEDQ